eukprot:1007-Eustigmatos_ZCMA.PRE.1
MKGLVFGVGYAPRLVRVYLRRSLFIVIAPMKLSVFYGVPGYANLCHQHEEKLQCFPRYSGHV